MQLKINIQNFMKIVSSLIAGLLLSAWLFTSCSGDTRIYAKELKAEKLLVEDYIKRNELRIVEEMPSNEEFLLDEKLYFKSTSGLYYRLEKEGRNDLDSLQADDKLKVGTKYLEYTLTQQADTADYWSPDVSQGWKYFTYGTNTEGMSLGFLEAVSYMRKTESEAKLIVTSKLGFNSSEVIPYGYKMKIRFTKNEIKD